jgi:hypothetical protein
MSFVYIEHFDRGLITTLGGEIIDVLLNGQTHQRYAVAVPGVAGPKEYGGKIPVFFIAGQSALTPQFYPSLLIRRNSQTADFSMGGAYYPIESIKPAPGATMVTVDVPGGGTRTGPRYVEIKQRATPERIEYTAVIESRGDHAQTDAAKMFRFFGGKILPPGGPLWLVDSDGDDRSYECIVEHSNELSVLDINTRSSIFTFSYTVQGELDFQGTSVVPTVLSTLASAIPR